MLHQLALASPFLQRALGELENDLFARRLAAVASRDEVFVTGLPRAGTTLLLELLYRTGEFQSFTYRDMPFIMSPLLWSKLARLDRRPSVAQARAHDDGLEISVDSPEAFEEVIWLAYLRARIVKPSWLEPVAADQLTPEASQGLRSAVHRLLAQRAPAGEPRYLSKNNANISRLGALAHLFPSSLILLVFRQPDAQAESLRRQHLRFTAIHAQDAFARRYMRWIGHYEFGADRRPINFSGWLAHAGEPTACDPDFWLRYWTAAYRYALEQRTDNVVFVDFDRLLTARESYLEPLARAIGLRKPAALTAQAGTLRQPTTMPQAPAGFAAGLWQEACELHQALAEAALEPDLPALSVA